MCAPWQQAFAVGLSQASRPVWQVGDIRTQLIICWLEEMKEPQFSAKLYPSLSSHMLLVFPQIDYIINSLIYSFKRSFNRHLSKTNIHLGFMQRSQNSVMSWSLGVSLSVSHGCKLHSPCRTVPLPSLLGCLPKQMQFYFCTYLCLFVWVFSRSQWRREMTKRTDIIEMQIWFCLWSVIPDTFMETSKSVFIW